MAWTAVAHRTPPLPMAARCSTCSSFSKYLRAFLMLINVAADAETEVSNPQHLLHTHTVRWSLLLLSRILYHTGMLVVKITLLKNVGGGGLWTSNPSLSIFEIISMKFPVNFGDYKTTKLSVSSVWHHGDFEIKSRLLKLQVLWPGNVQLVLPPVNPYSPNTSFHHQLTLTSPTLTFIAN